MPLTKEANDTAMRHIITVVLGSDLDGLLATALKNDGFTNVTGVITLTENDINHLYSKITNYGEDIPFRCADKALLRALTAFHRWKRDSGDPITDWTAITQDEFDSFRISSNYNPDAT